MPRNERDRLVAALARPGDAPSALEAIKQRQAAPALQPRVIRGRRVREDAPLQNRFGETERARRPGFQGAYLRRQPRRRHENCGQIMLHTRQLTRHGSEVPDRVRSNRPQVLATRNTRRRLSLRRSGMHRTSACPRISLRRFAQTQGTVIRQKNPRRQGDQHYCPVAGQPRDRSALHASTLLPDLRCSNNFCFALRPGREHCLRTSNSRPHEN